MFSIAKRATPSPATSFSGFQKRLFTPLAVYSKFPANFYYYRPKPKSSLYSRFDAASHPAYLTNEAVDVAPNRLVYPKAVRHRVNGATLFPETVAMQELIRSNYENFLEHHRKMGNEDEFKDVPVVYTIPQMTVIPEDLILVYKNPAWYSLQPSHGMEIKELNDRIDAFLENSAKKDCARTWLASRAVV